MPRIFLTKNFEGEWAEYEIISEEDYEMEQQEANSSKDYLTK